MKIIVNADDCGYSCDVNNAIESKIIAHKITSTTIMANMSDFDGAVTLYKKYSNFISFGIHLNLTEGEPLLYSQDLINYGYCQKINNHLVFNGSTFRNKILPRYICLAIKAELDAQIRKLLSRDIIISHIDSHHHIHTSLSIYPIICELAEQYNIKCVRALRNFPIFDNWNTMARKLWRLYAAISEAKFFLKLKKTDYFSSVQEFYEFRSRFTFDDSDVIELMCHPGGIYQNEEHILSLLSLSEFGSPINYNQL